MGNIKNIYFDWNKAGSGQVRQYDHLSNRVIFGNAPKFENYYLLVAMKESESDEQAKEMSPIKLTSPVWLIPNSYTQMVQQIKFQICNQDADGTFEQHSAEYTINVVESHKHEGENIDVDPSPMYDAYKEYVDDRIEELIDEAGDISVDTREYVDEKIQTMIAAAGDVAIDTTLSVSGAAADAKATGDAISETNERLGDLSDLETEDKSSIVNAINEASKSGGGVTGIGISTIIALTQDEYDEIQTKDPATLYIITDGEGGGDLPSYSVTNSLTHVTTTNQATSVLYGNTYSATLIPEENYFIDSVTVRMKGVDITESVYSNGVINIPSVTGNISITAIGDTTLISVPYLDSDGNSYIVTDFTPDKVGLSYEVKIKNIQTKAGLCLFGAYTFNKQQLSCLGDGSGWLDLKHDGVSASVKVPNPKSGVHTYKRTATEAYIDDMTIPAKTVSAGSAISTNPFSVFARSNGTDLSAYRLYYIKIYDTDGTTLLHEYVPAEHNGVACIYDTVNQTYFENQGTGSFTYGTELLG